MRHRRVGELMTQEVVGVPREAPFKEIVRVLAEHAVTAVPVLDVEDRVLGVVSEGDLLRKTADHDAGPDDFPAGLRAWERAKAEGTRAEEVMSAPAVCVRPDWTVVQAARLMEVHDVKRLIVVDEEDRLLGVVSRRDLLRVFLRDDEAIRREIVEGVLRDTLNIGPDAVTVTVRDGRVELGGRLPARGMIPAVERMCATVDGVVSVATRIAFDEDDVRRAARAHS